MIYNKYSGIPFIFDELTISGKYVNLYMILCNEFAQTPSAWSLQSLSIANNTQFMCRKKILRGVTQP